MTNFNQYKLSDDILKAISILNFKSPTKVQQQVIPAVLEQKDILIKSQTGSGKTAAFAIPICELIEWDENKPQVLVITPTRELAIQVKDDIFNIGRFKRIKAVTVYGKSPINLQERELKQKTHVVVGTPGRIIDHIERETLDLSNIRYLVIDEADEMFRMGFIEQVENIIKGLPKERITILLSATLSEQIKDLSQRYMKNPINVEIEEQDLAVDRIYQERYSVGEKDKIKLLRDILMVENPDSCMIFCNTKVKVDEVFDELEKSRYACSKIHGGLEQNDRTRIMHDFKLGAFRYLVATDVAARGIDVENITLVINYDTPEEVENYVHRIGRTGRIGNKGKAITFVAENEVKFLNEIHQYIGKEIILKERPQQEVVDKAKQEFIKKTNEAPEIRESKGAQLNKEIMKLHINAGKKTKMRAVDIVGTLCGIDGMTKDDIGIINVGDISTYVEILNNKGEMVYQKLQDRPIKGRLRRVSKADR